MFLYADSNIVSPYSKYNGPNILATRRNKPVNGAGDTTTTCFFYEHTKEKQRKKMGNIKQIKPKLVCFVVVFKVKQTIIQI